MKLMRIPFLLYSCLILLMPSLPATIKKLCITNNTTNYTIHYHFKELQAPATSRIRRADPRIVTPITTTKQTDTTGTIAQASNCMIALDQLDTAKPYISIEIESQADDGALRSSIVYELSRIGDRQFSLASKTTNCMRYIEPEQGEVAFFNTRGKESDDTLNLILSEPQQSAQPKQQQSLRYLRHNASTQQPFILSTTISSQIAQESTSNTNVWNRFANMFKPVSPRRYDSVTPTSEQSNVYMQQLNEER